MNNSQIFEYCLQKKVISYLKSFNCYKCNVCNNMLYYTDEKLDRNKQFRVIEHLQTNHKITYNEVIFNIEKLNDLRLW